MLYTYYLICVKSNKIYLYLFSNIQLPGITLQNINFKGMARQSYALLKIVMLRQKTKEVGFLLIGAFNLNIVISANVSDLKSNILMLLQIFMLLLLF
jgi:hypothetical protein